MLGFMSKNPAYLVSYEQEVKQFYGSVFPVVNSSLVTVVRENVNCSEIIFAVSYGSENCTLRICWQALL